VRELNERAGARTRVRGGRGGGGGGSKIEKLCVSERQRKREREKRRCEGEDRGLGGRMIDDRHTDTYKAYMIHVHHAHGCTYGVASDSRLLKMIGLFCKRAL